MPYVPSLILRLSYPLKLRNFLCSDHYPLPTHRVFQQQQENAPQNPNPTFEDLSIDDNLSQLDRLVRYTKSSIGLQRLVHAKMISDVSESVGYDTTKSLVMPLLADLAIDPEPAVRQHMVEQLSSVATVNLVILCFLFCNLVVINYLNLPIFVVLCK